MTFISPIEQTSYFSVPTPEEAAGYSPMLIDAETSKDDHAESDESSEIHIPGDEVIQNHPVHKGKITKNTDENLLEKEEILMNMTKQEMIEKWASEVVVGEYGHQVLSVTLHYLWLSILGNCVYAMLRLK